jgi:anti-anti-sigma factor
MTDPTVFAVEESFDPSGRVCVLALVGKLDPLAAEELQPRVDALHARGTRHFVFDLGRLEYVGSLGLRVLVALANKVKGEGGVAVCNPCPPVQSILDMTKTGRVLPVYGSRADAIDAVRSR